MHYLRLNSAAPAKAGAVLRQRFSRCRFYGLAAGLLLSAAVCGAPLPAAPAADDAFRYRQQARWQQPASETAAAPAASPTSLTLTSAELAQRPELLYRLLQSLLQDNQMQAAAKFLPMYERLPDADRDFIVYAKARLCRADGDYACAVRRLRELIAKRPDWTEARLQLAVSLAQDQQWQAAKAQFEKIRADEKLSAADRDAIQQLENRFTQQKNWDFSFNMRYLAEDNVNNAPKERHYGGWTFAAPQKAHGIGYSADGSYTLPAADHWGWQSSIGVYGKSYWDNHAYDDLAVRADSGVVWRDARCSFALAPYIEYRRYGGRRYSHGYGISVQADAILTPHWRNFTSLQLGRTLYPDRAFLNGNKQYFSTVFLYRSRPQQSFYGGINASHIDARDASDRSRRFGALAGWGQEWPQGISTNAQFNFGLREYAGPDLLNIKRRDKEYEFDFSIWNRAWHFHGLTPRLHWQVNQNDSNHPLYRYHN